jgi:hypothetical protein
LRAFRQPCASEPGLVETSVSCPRAKLYIETMSRGSVATFLIRLVRQVKPRPPAPESAAKFSIIIAAAPVHAV